MGGLCLESFRFLKQYQTSCFHPISIDCVLAFAFLAVLFPQNAAKFGVFFARCHDFYSLLRRLRPSDSRGCTTTQILNAAISYRWVPLYANMDNPNSWIIGSHRNSTPISPKLICMLNLKFGQFKRILFGITFLDKAGGTCTDTGNMRRNSSQVSSDAHDQKNINTIYENFCIRTKELLS